MKFLSPNMDGKNLMILNIYYDRGSYDPRSTDDVLDIIYKDMDTGQKFVETIKNPEFEVWVLKPEFRTFSHIKDYEDRSRCVKVKVHYKSRFKELSDLMKIPLDKIKFSPYIFQADMDICHFYIMHFGIEYGNDIPKKLSCGFLDIENDIINVKGFPEPGEAPINAVSYLDADTMQMYTLVLTTDNVPIVSTEHRKYEFYETLRSRFRTQMNEFEHNLDDVVTELHGKFDERYGEINYQILTFDTEINLIVALFKIIEACDNDYIQIWNSPYDMQNLIERPKALGYDPNTIIVHKAFGRRGVYFHEDHNALVQKRKHICNTYTKYTVLDQMVIYAGIRSGRGKLPSVKLNAVAKAELKDEKLDYSEYGNIRMFPYYDFRKFIIYNIKDVLLQFGIHKKTNDISSIYATIHLDCVTPNEIFTSTAVVCNSLRKYAYLNENQVMGSNRNRLYPVNDQEDIPEPDIGGNENIDDDDDVEEDDDDGVDIEDIETTPVIEAVAAPTTPGRKPKKKKKDKFQGAYVMSPVHMTPSGYEILGTPSKYVHKHVIDEDIGAEYPTAMCIMNSCNETLVGKVFLDNPEDITLPFYDNMYFVNKTDSEGYAPYLKDPSNLMMEVLTQDDEINFGTLFLNLPEPNSILEFIGDNIKDFK